MTLRPSHVIVALLLAALVVLALSWRDAHGRATCGIDRWTIKTLQDRPRLFPTRRSTVKALTELDRPRFLPPRSRLRLERRVYRLRVELVGFKSAEDEDYHVVIRDFDGGVNAPTMVVEFPAEHCTSRARLSHLRRMARARAAFVNLFGQPTSRFQRSFGMIEVTGVLFFDRLHRVTGRAPNAVELHPVLDVRAWR